MSGMLKCQCLPLIKELKKNYIYIYIYTHTHIYIYLHIYIWVKGYNDGVVS